MSTVYTVNGKVLKNAANDKWLAKKEAPVDPYNPLGLPPNTVRVRTSDGKVPSKTYGAMYGTATLVPGTTDVYDVYKSGQSFQELLYSSRNVVEVLGANTTDITDMRDMFNYCNSLTTVSLFDTSNVKFAGSMFQNCTSLTNIPLFNISKAVNINGMFYGCTNVQSGALALYQQASTQANPPNYHTNTFKNCGSNTQTGTAELAQIPSSWGGTGA